MEGISVLAGNRTVRLTASSAAMIGIARPVEADGKLVHSVAGPAPSTCPVRLIAILATGERDELREIGGAECVAALLACAFARPDEAERLALCTELAKSVRVVRLALRRDLWDLAGRVEGLVG